MGIDKVSIECIDMVCLFSDIIFGPVTAVVHINPGLVVVDYRVCGIRGAASVVVTGDPSPGIGHSFGVGITYADRGTTRSASILAHFSQLVALQ